MSGNLPPMNYAILGAKVDNLDTEFKEIKSRLTNLDSKIDTAITGLGQEVRTALASVTAQFAERNRTPWGTISGLGGLLLVIIGAFVNQALNPIYSDITQLKNNTVPRIELDYRAKQNERTFDLINGRLATVESQRYQELQRAKEDLAKELSDVRRGWLK